MVLNPIKMNAQTKETNILVLIHSRTEEPTNWHKP
jgi:hypothetical protein